MSDYDPSAPSEPCKNPHYRTQDGVTFYYDDTAFKFIAVWWTDIDFAADTTSRAQLADRIMREIGSP